MYIKQAKPINQVNEVNMLIKKNGGNCYRVSLLFLNMYYWNINIILVIGPEYIAVLYNICVYM